MELLANGTKALHEGWHDFYQVPIVHQRSIRDLNLGAHAVSVHKAPSATGHSVDFYAQLPQANELFVSFHGSVNPIKRTYPAFWRIESMQHRVPAMLSIADPTLQLHSELWLSWYAGGPGWDPMDEIVSVVEQARAHVGAQHVAFLGGSGGGFASLRAAARFPGSLAFPQDPQTHVGRYVPRHRDSYFRMCWPGHDQDVVMAAEPERFDLTHLYATRRPEVFVYYRQSLDDPFHLRNHARPFMDAMGNHERATFVLEHGERPGHGKITPAEFDRHFDLATQWWREMR